MEQIARSAKQIGVAFRRRRRALGLTQAALGRKTNLRQATISEVESGRPGTQLRTLASMMAALELELVVRERTKSPYDFEDLF